ncbi:MAG: sigma 54-interacting transcriptional regulator [Candidatus Margulisbacteria bacterium]|nr:sigma 54-interacting transcriptional regulator [Candidatus Margulisiibacteriota bacterium]
MTDTSHQQLKPLFLFKGKQEEILKRWYQEVTENPHFSKESFVKNENFEAHSKAFLIQLMHTLENHVLMDISKETLTPLFKLWHDMMKEQRQKGFTYKDTAMLIFSLKAAVMNFMKENEDTLSEGISTELSRFDQILDFLGLLTFEIYTAEKEKLISRQDNQIEYLQKQRHEDQGYGKIIGNSPQMRAVYKAIGLVLENDVTVLIEGESGTGKELVANSIHDHSRRKSKPFVALNCGAIPKDIVESELFGHEKGSFTGAIEKRLGKFELAEGGTLFLDEVGELSLDNQVKLLRALQNKEIERVGGSDLVKVNVRIIAATNQTLRKLVDQKKFRLDLFYRLNVFPMTLPALRDRKSDILLLAQYLLEKYAKQFEVQVPDLSIDAGEYLTNQRWEGNVRELENVIQRALILSQGKPITSMILQYQPGDVEHVLLQAPTQKEWLAQDNIEPLHEMEKRAIEAALKLKKGNVRQTAKALGISRTTFYNKAKKYQILFT